MQHSMTVRSVARQQFCYECTNTNEYMLGTWDRLSYQEYHNGKEAGIRAVAMPTIGQSYFSIRSKNPSTTLLFIFNPAVSNLNTLPNPSEPERNTSTHPFYNGHRHAATASNRPLNQHTPPTRHHQQRRQNHQRSEIRPGEHDLSGISPPSSSGEVGGWREVSFHRTW